MTIEETFQKVCEDPESDSARLAFADLIEASDPDHATLIRLDVAYAKRRRVGLPRERDDIELRQDLIREQERWARNLARFLPRGRSEGEIYSDGLIFDRGFPARISVHPYIFLEYADLLFRLAPLRHVRFREPYDEDELLSGAKIANRPDGTPTPFPLDEILAMPQLSRLDSFGFDFSTKNHEIMPKDLWQRIAACPHLTRCKVLDTNRFVMGPWHFEALAAGALTGKMIRFDHCLPYTFPGETRVEDDTQHYVDTRTEFSDLGKALEQKHGYIPWLHPSHNKGDTFDIAYLVQHGELPKYPPGTPPMPEWYEFPTEKRRKSWW